MYAEIKERIRKKCGSGSFGFNVLTLMSGTTVSQALPILVSPILTRLYSSGDFGGLALFQSLLAVASAFACLRYEMTIVLCRNDKEIVNMVAVSVAASVMTSSLLALIILLWHKPIIRLLHAEILSDWLYLFPAIILLIGINNALVYANLREKNFSIIAKANVFKSFAMAVTSVILGLMNWGMKGLIYGHLVSIITGNRELAVNLLKRKEYLKLISLEEMKKLAVRFIQFPLFSTMGAVMNALTQNLANFLIIGLFSQDELGLYALSTRILGVPLQMIGQSIGQVYLQRASEEKRLLGNAKKIFDATLKHLAVISILLGVVLYFSVEELCTLIFGPQWRLAGVYTIILLPLFMVRFVSSTLSVTLGVFEKQKQSLLINCSLFIAMITIFAITKTQGLSISSFLYLYSGILSVLYFCFLIYYKILSKGEKNDKVANIIDEADS